MIVLLRRISEFCKALIGKADYPHSYLCVAHGGSPATEKKNRVLGFQCPECKRR